MSRVISFRVTEIEHAMISADARAKGLTASTYAKNCLMTHINRSPSKGVFATLQEELSKLRQQTAGAPDFVATERENKEPTTPSLTGLEQGREMSNEDMAKSYTHDRHGPDTEPPQNRDEENKDDE